MWGLVVHGLKKIMKVRETVRYTPYWHTVENDKRYQTGEMYKAIRGDKEKVSWDKTMLHNLARFRATFTLWMTFNGKLSTKDRFIRFGMHMDLICSFCD